MIIKFPVIKDVDDVPFFNFFSAGKLPWVDKVQSTGNVRHENMWLPMIV